MDIPADGVPAPQRYWAVLTIALAVGLAVVASLCCAVSGSLVELTLARVLQGLGAAGIMSVNSALTRFVYPRSQLGRGMGINALVAATCAALGPTLASGILSIADWTWLFAINVPLGLIAFVIALRSLPATPRALHRFDALSALLSGLTFGLLIIGIDSYAHGGGAVGAVVELGASAVCGAVLVRRQLDRSAPLLPVDLLAIPLFRLSAATSVLSFAAQALAVVSLPFILEGAMAWNATETGLLMTPWPVATAIMAPLAGRLADRHSAGILGGIGMAAFATGLVLLAVLPADAGAANIGWRMAVCGMGFGFFQSPNNRAMITSAPLSRSGGASGMLGTARLLGQTVGAALVALIFGLSGHTTVAALVVAAAFAACGGIASLLRLSPARTPPAR
jgi:DHA2 family multidrug resistance protein-like MFS transporter